MELLKKLTAVSGPSGREEEVRRVLTDAARPFADELTTDTLGNLFVHKKSGVPDAPLVLVAAHMDEIGVMLTHIDEEGFLRFASVGGFRPALAVGERLILPGGLAAVVAAEYRDASRNKPEERRYYLDTGLNYAETIAAGLKPGDMGTFNTAFYETPRTVTAKALDNRLGCYVLLETLKELKSPADVCFVFTVQEEVGARGALTATHALSPALAFVVDVTPAEDIPEAPVATLRLHAGPAIKVMDRSIVTPPAVTEQMAAIATRHDLAFQWEVMNRGGTDAGSVQLSGRGVLTGGIALPLRYVHSMSEIAAKEDISGAVRLLKYCLEEWDYAALRDVK
jgi:endoglucanase